MDVQNDYYGMLDISPNAETDEIKKQFKKLGESKLPQFNVRLFICWMYLRLTQKFKI